MTRPSVGGDQRPKPGVAEGNAAAMLWQSARDSGERTAIVERESSIDWRTLCAHAGAVTAHLLSNGVRSGDRVGVFVERGAGAAAAFFGTLAAGAIAININETLRPRQIEYILHHAGASRWLTSAGLLARLPRAVDHPAPYADVGELIAAGDPLAAGTEPQWRSGSDVAHIIYTSGSTGLPKGVAVTHANLWAGTRAVAAYLQLDNQDRIASLLPFSFDYGLNQLLCAAHLGAALVVERSPLPQQIVATLRARDVTVLPCVPALWLQLLSAPTFAEAPLRELRAMTNTGGRLPVDAVRRLRACQPQANLFLMYGLTEAFRATYLPPEHVDAHPDSIGIAIPGAEILVLREDGTPCAPHEEGELVQRGPTVAAGYWNDPASTARVFRSNPVRPPGAPDAERVVFSGDLVWRDDQGLLYFIGRRDHMIKTLGYRVSPDEIANVLHASGEVAAAVVSGEPDGQRGEEIVAHVVLRSGGSVESLARFCGVELPRYMQPTRFEVHTELPRTASGKFDIGAVRGRSGSPSARRVPKVT